MKWFLCLAALIGLVGCGKQTDDPVQPESSSVAAAAMVAVPPPVLTQQVITDENGTQQTITVPLQSITPVPPARLPTVESLRRDARAVLKEMTEVVKKTLDLRTVEECKALHRRLSLVEIRLESANPDLAYEQEEIRQIRAALAKCR